MDFNAEQQEHLKVLHEKFKKELNQYLQECKGAMEGLESQHIELQGAIEKQSMTTLSYHSYSNFKIPFYVNM